MVFGRIPHNVLINSHLTGVGHVPKHVCYVQEGHVLQLPFYPVCLALKRA